MPWVSCPGVTWGGGRDGGDRKTRQLLSLLDAVQAGATGRPGHRPRTALPSPKHGDTDLCPMEVTPTPQ